MPPPEVDCAQATVSLDGPLPIRSGRAAPYGLLVTDLTSRELLITSSGTLIGEIADPATDSSPSE